MLGNELQLSYRMMGDGPPILLLHGISSHSAAWQRVMDVLSTRYTIIAWDAPGYGDSAMPEKPLHIADYARIGKDLIEALGFSSVVLVGHSFGAMVAIKWAHCYPETVNALILADVTFGHGNRDQDWRQQQQNERAQLMRLSPEDYAKKRVPRLLSPHATPEVVAEAETIVSRLHNVGYQAALTVLFETDQRTKVPTLRQPTLVVWGRHDVVTPYENAEWIRTQLGSSIVLIEDAGHWCYFEKPVEFCHAMEDFLCQQFSKENGNDRRDPYGA
jgi:pimeloyl-ACP methyl ester carboxylesterase